MTDVGDFRVATLSVVDADGTPGDGTTNATLTVVAPDGTTSTPSVSTTDSGPSWESTPYELTAPGEWIERWVVTGRGAGKQRTSVLVAPDPADVPSGARVYATTGDYATWLQAAPPAGARGALARASKAVDQMLVCAIYDVDDDGLPTDADVAAAMRDATCAQAEFAGATGDPLTVGATQFHSMTIGSISLGRGYNAAGSAAPGRYSTQAWELLQQAGLVGGNGPMEP